MNFDKTRLYFTVNPTKTSGIPYYESSQQYYEETIVRVKITDTNSDYNTTDFYVIVQHKIPKINTKVSSL